MTEDNFSEVEIPDAKPYSQEVDKRLAREIQEAALDLASQLVNAYLKTDGSLTERYMTIERSKISGKASRYLQNWKMFAEAAKILNSKNWCVGSNSQQQHAFLIEPRQSVPERKIGFLDYARFFSER